MGPPLRFELIDQVIEQTGDRLVGLKNLTAAEEYLQDHFPRFPVMPGVLMLETLAQAGRLLLAERCPEDHLVIQKARNVKYGNMVRPGQSLRVEVELTGSDERGFDLTGVGTVDGQVAVSGKLRLEPLGPVETPEAPIAPAAAGGA